MPNPERHPWVTAAIVWIVLWAFAFVVLGFNHSVASHPDAPTVFLLASIIAVFLVSLWFLSSRPRRSATLALNLVAFAAVLGAAVLVPRDPSLMTVRWSVAGERSSMLIASWVWPAVIWLSIAGASGVAEAHHVLRSRAR